MICDARHTLRVLRDLRGSCIVVHMHQTLTTAQAARLLGVDPATVRRWATEGKITAVRTLGGHRRFTPEEIERVKAGSAA